MNTDRTCPQCQQPLPADAPAGLCPQCLMNAASGPPPSTAEAGLPGDIIDIGDPAEVAKKLPQFEILELLGRGGMGVVYKARQLQLDRIVALKILPPVDALSPDFVARFGREARALAKLNHANIVQVHDFGEAGGLYFIVMEFVDGANLRQLFEGKKLMPVEAMAIVPKICDALEYAHQEGLVHRDIKPENLLIDTKGRVKIADFGLAKLLRREPLDLTLTLSGMSLGTLRYMAPEQMEHPDAVDHRADIYSLGVVIYEMLTGELPVGRFALPSEKAQVDVRLDTIVLHALERDVALRYQHASEVRDDVEKMKSEPQTAPRPKVAAPRRRRLPMLIGTLLLLSLAVVAGIILLSMKQSLDGGSLIEPADPPPLKTITSGIGANFTVPAGQVAIFEVVTRRDNTTVALPFHAGYAMAPADREMRGTFRWFPGNEGIPGGDDPKRWKIEIKTARAGSSGEGWELPAGFAVVGAHSLGLALQPDSEAIYWGTPDATKLPANGLVGLRVRTLAHGRKAGQRGSEGRVRTSTTDWMNDPSPIEAANPGEAAALQARLDSARLIASAESREAALAKLALEAATSRHGAVAAQAVRDLASTDLKDRTGEECVLALIRAGEINDARTISEMIDSSESRKRVDAAISQSR